MLRHRASVSRKKVPMMRTSPDLFSKVGLHRRLFQVGIISCTEMFLIASTSMYINMLTVCLFLNWAHTRIGRLVRRAHVEASY